MENDQYQQPPQTQYLPELGRAGSSGYSAEHYQFLSSLIESRSARAMFIQIKETDFSAQCINAFYKIITSGFDQNAILARNENLTIRIIDFEIALNLMVLECHESDIQNPAFLTFRENILQMFKDFVSRSKNAKERDQLLRQEYGVQEQRSQQQGQQQQGQGVLQRMGRQQ